MIIRCEKCDTKYRLDDSMISTSSVKVQCSKCAHIFIVPSVKENHGIRDLEANEAASTPSPPTPPAPSHEDFDLSPHGGATNESEQEVKADAGAGADTGAGAETGEEAGAEPEEEGESTPSQTFDKTFSAPHDDEPEEAESEEEVDTKTAHEEPSAGVRVESYIAGSNTSGEEALREDKDIGVEKETPEAEPSRDFDLTFDSPDEAPKGEAEAETGDETGDDKAEEESETGQSEAAAQKSSEPEDRDKNEEVSSTEELPQHIFEATFNTPDEAPAGDGEVKRDFIASEASTDETPQPMAKYYIDRPSPNAGEDLSQQKAPEQTEKEPDIVPAKTEPEDDTALINELLMDGTEAGKGGTDKKTDKKAGPKYDKNLVIPGSAAEEGVKRSGIAGAIAIIVIILALAGGVIYVKSQPQSRLMAPPSGEKTIEIESVKGYYVLNKDSGRIFVIESIIKNIRNEPVKISGIHGLVLDSSGQEMDSKTVSPGRVVNAKDLRTLPADRLLRSFSDTSESTIPKKAVIPTMILFPDLNDAVAEYGIDVLR
ncbi:MAG: zinc-ribbon domain-containing protein [Thermodesulfobacteriota bacterium]